MPASTGPAYGGQDVQNGNRDYERRKAIYDRTPNDNFHDYLSRTFNQSTQSYNNGVSQDPSNVFADSPWARFYNNQYGTRAPVQYMVGRMLRPDAYAQYGADGHGGEETGLGLENYLKQFHQGGLGAGPIGDYRQTLSGLTNLINQRRNDPNNTANMDPTQMGLAQNLLEDPQMVAAVLSSYLGGATGVTGQRHMVSTLRRLQDNYYQQAQDPSNPSGPGPFWNQALKALGLG